LQVVSYKVGNKVKKVTYRQKNWVDRDMAVNTSTRLVRQPGC